MVNRLKAISTSFYYFLFVLLIIVGCNNSNRTSNNTEDSVSEEINDGGELSRKGINNEGQKEENYFEFLNYLNIGLTPSEIANIMPSGARLEKPEDYMDDLDDFLYHLDSDHIKGFVKFYKWNYDDDIWSFECSLNWEKNPKKGEELYNEILNSLINIYGIPQDQRHYYSNWEVQINGDPAMIKLIKTESTIVFMMSFMAG